MDTQLEKVYDPKNVEKKWYQYWKEEDYFKPEEDSDKESYVITIPPPNVTGVLHMGHVMNNTIQDILIRYARMQGYNTLWLPGTDHAGIATQSVVEKKLRKEGTSRHELGREKFVEEVWKWADKHKSIIFQQLEELGSSFDRSRERFTFDQGLSKAVRKVFVHLYEKGLIYRGKRIINWCPASQTALSDEEVIHRETKGKLYYYYYPLKDEDKKILIATTRPETMLGDTGVAVNPEDKRYQNLIGKKAILPLVGRELPIVADEFVDPEFGTGIVKVTPAHDPNDFDMGQKHDLEIINILNKDGTLNENAGEKYEELDRFEARKKVVKNLKKEGLLEKIEEHEHNVGYSERADVMVEPMVSQQWFVKMKPLAEPALKAVEEGKVQFHPQRWVKTYNHWLENIHDWCISRQLWWGHRIPVFYCDSCNWEDALMEDPEECPECGAEVRQDKDVLDTWFSSWLWPFSTMGWPQETKDLKQFFPTDDLVTAPDIIFFWVARMIMASLEFMGEVPFTDVYFTGIIRDSDHRKMSKSLGNSPDPLHLIDKYGADTLRYGIMLIAPQGSDIIYSEERLKVGRNFLNKIWNASRFVMMNLDDQESDIINNVDDLSDIDLTLADKWILSRLHQTIDEVDKYFDKYRFDQTAQVIYDFIWGEYCDWYIEIIKDKLYNGTSEEQENTLRVALYTLKNILKLLHPFTPFITEEIYQKIKAENDPDLIVSSWPEKDEELIKPNVEKKFALLQKVITSIRTARSEINIPPGKQISLAVKGEDQQIVQLFEEDETAQYIKSQAKIKKVSVSPDISKPDPSSSLVVEGVEMYIPLAGVIDLDAEKERLKKQIKKVEGYLESNNSKLNNHNFVENAPAEVVEKERKKKRDNQEKLKKLKKNMKILSE
ncbi:MAG: valine--tRNA ligase [Candidatus Marinimicrobia bacterium]|nr:valine--tRNA ligase [Candidatus Neomarinimicrobiota bacterium]